MHKRALTTAAAIAPLAGALALAAPAGAHVTLHPNAVPAGAYAVLDVRVPNEMDNANTTRVDLQLPDGFASASWAPVPGWRVKVRRQKLAKPIHTEDGTIDTEVREIVWTAERGGAIPPGAFQQFPLSVAMPAASAGRSLTFKALQTYSNGQVVRWIGPPSSDHPAPTVRVTAAGGAIQDLTGDAHPPTPDAPIPARAASGGSSDTLAIVAIVLAALALVAGGGALLARRRSAGAP